MVMSEDCFLVVLVKIPEQRWSVRHLLEALLLPRNLGRIFWG